MLVSTTEKLIFVGSFLWMMQWGTRVTSVAIQCSILTSKERHLEDAVSVLLSGLRQSICLRHHLDITVVHRGLKREGAVGFCTVMDCDHRPREFLIEMETTLSEDLYCQTLLHELWHVYQHVIGTLRDKRGVRYWKNIDSDHLSYQDQPWEQEAQQMEIKLYNCYLGLGPKSHGTGTPFPNRLTSS